MWAGGVNWLESSARPTDWHQRGQRGGREGMTQEREKERREEEGEREEEEGEREEEGGRERERWSNIEREEGEMRLTIYA